MGTMIVAWMDVRAKPLRTLAAIAGLVAAVVAVVLVDASGIVSQDANGIYLARRYGLPVTVSIYSETGNETRESVATLEDVLASNGITLASPATVVSVFLTYQGQPVTSGAYWVNSQYPNIKITEMVIGSWPTTTANSDTLHAVVPSGWAESTLGLPDQQVVGVELGMSLDLTSSYDARTTAIRPVIIDGVVSTQTNAFALMDSSVILVSNEPGEEVRSNVPSMSWNARINPSDFTMLQELLEGIVDDSGRQIYRMDRVDSSDDLAPVLEQQRVTGTAVSAVALVIGGLGILSVGVAGVRERASEYALRRALGATRAQIFGSVVLQTLLEVLLAALIAIPLAGVLLQLFARELVLDVLPLPPAVTLPLQSALLGLASALVVGLIAGLLPAATAARSSVVGALRG